MKNKTLIITLFLSFQAFSQVGINTDTPNEKSVLHISEQLGTNEKIHRGILTPRYSTAERDAHFSLSAPENGLLIYNTTQGCYNYWKEDSSYTTDNGTWVNLCGDLLFFKLGTPSPLTGTGASTGFSPSINGTYSGEVKVAYTGGDGKPYAEGEPFTVEGLTFTLQPGILNPDGGELVYKVNGKPTSSGNKSAILSFKDQSISVDYIVKILPCENETFIPGSHLNQVFNITRDASWQNETQVMLTPYDARQVGQMWSKYKIDFNQSFTLKVNVYLGNQAQASFNAGHGMAIVFQNHSSENTIGIDDGGLGAKGIPNGIALELDTNKNSDIDTLDPIHGQIWITSTQQAITSPKYLFAYKVNTWYNVVVTWNSSTKRLSYTVNGIEAGSHTFSNINTYFGNSSQAYFGFTASTAHSRNEHRVRIVNPCSDLPL